MQTAFSVHRFVAEPWFLTSRSQLVQLFDQNSKLQVIENKIVENCV